MIRPLRSTTSAAPPQTALNSDRAAMPDDPTILIITGVSGSGKATIATALAQRLRWPFKEGADLHPASDISKMHVGHPPMTAPSGLCSKGSQTGSMVGGRPASPA